MQESEIRSDEMIAETKRLHKMDVERILREIADFVEVGCPACNKRENDFVWEKEEFTFVECSFCGTVFVNPRPTKETLFNFYIYSLKIRYWTEVVYPVTESSRIEHLVLPRVKKVLDLCAEHNISPGSIMDVGAGSGTFCKQMVETGKFRCVYAIEPTLGDIEGVDVIRDFIENIAEKEVDVITSFESIEHLFSPREYLNGAFRMLNSGGLLFFTTPNIKGFDLSVLKDKSDNVVAPEHLNYFHSKSISLLLENCGFEVLNIETPGKLDTQLVRKKVLAEVLSLDNNPFLKQVLIDDWRLYGHSFQQWLVTNGLSSSMLVVAKKE